MNNKTLGQVAFEAMEDREKWPFSDEADSMRAKWEAAAEAVKSEVLTRDKELVNHIAAVLSENIALRLEIERLRKIVESDGSGFQKQYLEIYRTNSETPAERRRYALLQAAASSSRFLTTAEAVNRAMDLLAEIERREQPR